MQIYPLSVANLPSHANLLTLSIILNYKLTLSETYEVILVVHVKENKHSNRVGYIIY